jgi:DNA/RNA-binding domain of Phe-tRNA-synthetase-like protein
VSDELDLREGAIAPEVADEFPELRLWSVEVAAGSGRSPAELKERLKVMSGRFRGADAVMMRQQPIPWAYRVFFRHVGLDPDDDRTPVEAMALERLMRGGFKSRNLLDDALTIAVMETGVPVWALDADRSGPDLEIRQASEYEPFAPTVWLPKGRLVVSDPRGPVAELFGDTAPGRGVTKKTTRTLLYSVQVAGVPSIHVEEALWSVQEILEG